MKSSVPIDAAKEAGDFGPRLARLGSRIHRFTFEHDHPVVLAGTRRASPAFMRQHPV